MQHVFKLHSLEEVAYSMGKSKVRTVVLEEMWKGIRRVGADPLVSMHEKNQ